MVFSHAPRRPLCETHFEADVDHAFVVVGCVELRQVAVDHCHRQLSGGHHVDEVLGDDGVVVDRVDVYAAANLAVEIAQTRLVLRALDHVDVASHELCDIGHAPLSVGGLHEHLIGDVGGAAVEHVRLVFGRLWNLDG